MRRPAVNPTPCGWLVHTAGPLLVMSILIGCAPDGADPEGDVDAVADAITQDAFTLAPITPDVTAPDVVAPDVVAPDLGPAIRPDDLAVPDELAALSAVLIVPVAGVERWELHDTFTQGRGDGERSHEAIDILAPRGTPVLSATDGRLLRLFDSEPGGLMVYATDASERFILLYGHLDGYAAGLRDGMALARGQVIGYVGTTGNAPPETPHLHFGILRGDPAVSWSGGVAVNPYPLLTAGGPEQ
jgi:peptidoglycan LD-endopeptidase LytH